MSDERDNVVPIKGPGGGPVGRRPSGKKGEQTSKRTIASAERRAKAMALRLAGYNYQQIADKIRASHGGAYSKSMAFKDIEKSIDQLVIEPAVRVLELNLGRLAAAMTAVWPAVMEGDVQAIAAMLKIMEREARYLGLDSPVRQVILGADAATVMDLSDPRRLFEAGAAAIEAMVAEREVRVIEPGP